MLMLTLTRTPTLILPPMFALSRMLALCTQTHAASRLTHMHSHHEADVQISGTKYEMHSAEECIACAVRY